MTRVLALDLGGTKLRAAIAEEPHFAALGDAGVWPAPASLASLEATMEALLHEAGAIDRIGIAVPGLVEGSRCRWIPNLPWLDGVDLATLFPAQAIAVGNDAQIALLAEAAQGAAAGLSDVLLLSIGTGIGSAVLAGGRIVKGARGGACSFGWACADASAPADPAAAGWSERPLDARSTPSPSMSWAGPMGAPSWNSRAAATPVRNASWPVPPSARPRAGRSGRIAGS